MTVVQQIAHWVSGVWQKLMWGIRCKTNQEPFSLLRQRFPATSLESPELQGVRFPETLLGGEILKTNDTHLNKNDMLKWYEIDEDNLFWIGFIDRSVESDSWRPSTSSCTTVWRIYFPESSSMFSELIFSQTLQDRLFRIKSTPKTYCDMELRRKCGTF